MTPDFNGRHIVLDTETTGLSPKSGHRVVEIAAAELKDGKRTGRIFHSYINPERPVDPRASAVHGLTNQFLADKPVFADVARNLHTFLSGAPIWAHNAPFDARFINAEFEQTGFRLEFDFRCSLKLANRLPIGTPNNKLETLAAQIDHKWERKGPHSAFADVFALADVLDRLLWPLAQEHPDLGRSKPKATKRKAPKPEPRTVGLPKGFAPRTSDTDPRIRHYDPRAIDPAKLTAKGKRWSPDETQALVDAFVRGDEILDLVAAHGRTPAALILRLEAAGAVAPGHPYART